MGANVHEVCSGSSGWPEGMNRCNVIHDIQPGSPWPSRDCCLALHWYPIRSTWTTALHYVRNCYCTLRSSTMIQKKKNLTIITLKRLILKVSLASNVKFVVLFVLVDLFNFPWDNDQHPRHIWSHIWEKPSGGTLFTGWFLWETY